MKAVTIGGAMLDAIAIIDSERIERFTAQNAETSFLMLEEGRKIEAEEISNHVGGGAVNAAVAMARLGLDVSSVVKLGQDMRADAILSRLSDEGVSTRWVVRDPRAPTGASVLISSHEKDAAIFTFRGANTLLACADLREDMFAGDLVYISTLSNEAADCFPDIVRLAKSQGATVATNPGIRQLSSRGDSFSGVLGDVDILSVNRAEADALVPLLVAEAGEGGAALPLEPGEDAPTDLITRGMSGGGFRLSLKKYVETLVKLGPSTVVITAGRHGAIVGTADAIVHCPARQLDVIAGTAGGGDAFASTFAAMVADGRDIGEAVQAATHNAASVMGYADTQTGLMTREELAQTVGSDGAALALRRWSI